ncbi:MAG: dihydroorotate dehydrogenase electron transfer subunit [Myxococcota bacterium]
MPTRREAAQADRPSPLQVDAVVVENRDEAGAYRRLWLSVPGWHHFRPGQFVMLSAGALAAVPRNDPLLRRPMAVYRERGGERPGEAQIEILFRLVGRGTRLLADVGPGQRVAVVGPLGRPFPEVSDAQRSVLVGGGTGIASLYELAARAEKRSRLRVILGAASAADLMGKTDFEQLGVDLRLTTQDGSQGQRGLVTEALEASLAEGAVETLYICGPTPMMRRCAELATAHQIRCYVSLESVMACGFGVCLGCAAPLAGGGFALVCSRGPVMEAAEVDWEEML